MTKSSLKKTLFLAVGALLFAAGFVWQIPGSDATGQDSCQQETLFTVDEDNDSFLSFLETGNRVQVDFNGGSDDRNQAIITAGSGYQIMTVRYDNENFGTSWINFSVTNPTTTINLAGTSDSTRIDKVEVKVKKVCASPSPSPSPSAAPSPSTDASPGPSTGGLSSSDNSSGSSSSSTSGSSSSPGGEVLG